MADQDNQGAHAPGLAAPLQDALPITWLTAGPKDETPRLAGAEGFRDQRQADTHDCAQDGADGKRFATLQARLALRGFTLTRTDAAGSPEAYTVLRWNLARDLASLDAVAEFAIQVGARA